MSTLNISKATPLGFIIETGTGTIHDGETLPDNEPYASDTLVCGVVHPRFCQPYNCSDTTTIQIEYELTNATPLLVVCDEQNVVIVQGPIFFQIDVTAYTSAWPRRVGLVIHLVTALHLINVMALQDL